eukprot:4367759-Heterocapsa_arctica.AAC.1
MESSFSLRLTPTTTAGSSSAGEKNVRPMNASTNEGIQLIQTHGRPPAGAGLTGVPGHVTSGDGMRMTESRGRTVAVVERPGVSPPAVV